MLKWEKVGTEIFHGELGEAAKNITYRADGTDYEIQSRKRGVKHANGIGFWYHTTYWIMKDGKDLAEHYTMQRAKEKVELRMELEKGAENATD